MGIEMRGSCRRGGTVVSISVLLVTALAHAQVQSAGGQRRGSETLRDSKPTHQFAPVDPHWVKREEYLARRGPEAFSPVPAPPRGSRNGLVRQVTYYGRGQTGSPTSYLKLLRYDDAGRLMKEVDQTPNDRFERDLYPEGSVANNLHWRKGRGMVAGFSHDRAGRVTARLENGSGDVTTWVYGPDDYTRGSLEGGSYLLTRVYARRTLISETFWLPSGDSLRRTKAEERLTLASHREFWTAPEQGGAYGQVWPGQPQAQTGIEAASDGPGPRSDAIHQRLLASEFVHRDPSPGRAAAEISERAADYRSRRDEFLRKYTAYFHAVGRDNLTVMADPDADFVALATREFQRELARDQDDRDRRELIRGYSDSLLGDAHPGVRQRAISALANMNTGSAEPNLEQMLGDKDAHIRGDAIRMLVYAHAVQALPAIRLLLNDPDEHVRKEAREALNSLSSPLKP